MNLKEMTLDQLGALAYDQTKVKENATRNIYLIEEQMKIKQEEIEETNDREDKIEELIARNKSLEEANRGIIADLSDKRKELSQYKQQQQTYQQSMMSKEEIEEQMDRELTFREYQELRQQDMQAQQEFLRQQRKEIARDIAISSDKEFLEKEKVVLEMAKYDSDVADDLEYARSYVNKVNRLYKSSDDYIRKLKSSMGKEVVNKIKKNSEKVNIKTRGSKSGSGGSGNKIDLLAYDKLSAKEKAALPESERVRLLG